MLNRLNFLVRGWRTLLSSPDASPASSFSASSPSTGKTKRKRSSLETDADARARIAREGVAQTLLTLFPEDPCVLNGWWSWANTELDVVFPSLLLYDRETGEEAEFGLVVHSVRPGQHAEAERLFRLCQEKEINLLLMDAFQNPEEAEMSRRIEQVFGNGFVCCLLDVALSE